MCREHGIEARSRSDAALNAMVIALVARLAARHGSRDAFTQADRPATAVEPEGAQVELGRSVVRASDEALEYDAPPDSAIPDDELAASIRRGRVLLIQTTDILPAYAPGNIQCASCHLDAGRRRDAAHLLGVHARFPKYMDRTGAVIPVEDRVNYCFTRSMAATRLPGDSREMQDIVAYLAFLSAGVPVGAKVQGEGMLKMPALTGVSARGAAPADVAYATRGHAAYRPPAPLLPRPNPGGAVVPAPVSVRAGRAQRTR
jgi:thiosulfate dehydrogenase